VPAPGIRRLATAPDLGGHGAGAGVLQRGHRTPRQLEPPAAHGEALFVHCSSQLAVLQRAYLFSHARLVDCDLSMDLGRSTVRMTAG
jgi:hypothetical protein